MSDTLLVLWYRPDTKPAALLCTLSNSSLFFLVFGDHTVEQYSKFDLTIDLHAFSFVVSFLTFRFLCRIPVIVIGFSSDVTYMGVTFEIYGECNS